MSLLSQLSMWPANFELIVLKHGRVRVSHSPCSRIKLTVSVWPCWAARCRAVQPVESRTSRLTPAEQQPDTCDTRDRSWVRMSGNAWVLSIRKQTSCASACAPHCWVTSPKHFHFQIHKARRSYRLYISFNSSWQESWKTIEILSKQWVTVIHGVASVLTNACMHVEISMVRTLVYHMTSDRKHQPLKKTCSISKQSRPVSYLSTTSEKYVCLYFTLFVWG